MLQRQHYIYNPKDLFQLQLYNFPEDTEEKSIV